MFLLLTMLCMAWHGYIHSQKKTRPNFK